MILVRHDELRQKLADMRHENFLHILKKAHSVIRKKRVKSIGIYILDMQKNLLNPEKNIRKKTLDSLKGKIQLKILSNEDRTYFDEYVALRSDIKLTAKSQDETLKRGCLCFLAIMDKKIVGATSMAFKEYPLWGGFDLDFVFRDDQTYSFNTYVSPEVRSRGIGYFIKDYAIQVCSNRGYNYIIAAIYEDNKPSIKLCERFGYEKYGEIKVIDQLFTKRHRLISNRRNAKKEITLRLFHRKVVQM